MTSFRPINRQNVRIFYVRCSLFLKNANFDPLTHLFFRAKPTLTGHARGLDHIKRTARDHVVKVGGARATFLFGKICQNRACPSHFSVDYAHIVNNVRKCCRDSDRVFGSDTCYLSVSFNLYNRYAICIKYI